MPFSCFRVTVPNIAAVVFPTGTSYRGTKRERGWDRSCSDVISILLPQTESIGSGTIRVHLFSVMPASVLVESAIYRRSTWHNECLVYPENFGRFSLNYPRFRRLTEPPPESPLLYQRCACCNASHYFRHCILFLEISPWLASHPDCSPLW